MIVWLDDFLCQERSLSSRSYIRWKLLLLLFCDVVVVDDDKDCRYVAMHLIVCTFVGLLRKERKERRRRLMNQCMKVRRRSNMGLSNRRLDESSVHSALPTDSRRDLLGRGSHSSSTVKIPPLEIRRSHMMGARSVTRKDFGYLLSTAM